MTGTKVVIDCDAGIDDALALIILIAAHKQEKIQIKAITCVNGNTSVNNVVKNVFRTLDVCKATDVSSNFLNIICASNGYILTISFLDTSFPRSICTFTLH